MKRASQLERAAGMLARVRAWTQRERGVAILMVMVVLTGLLALAAPFVFSMIQHGRTARSDLQQARAESGARAAVDHAFAHLCRNLIKYKDPTGRTQAFDPTPDWDTLDELKVDLTLPEGGPNVTDPNGLFWSARIEDEQGKINLHSASPALFGNLLGSAVLVEPAGSSSTELVVDDASAFASDGDPATVDGEICLGFSIKGRDKVHYSHIVGNRIILSEAIPAEVGKLPKGRLVFDARARDLLDYNYPSTTVFRPFRSLYEVKALGSFRQDEFARIERFITIYSDRGGPEWGRGQLNLATGIHTLQSSIPVENPTGMGVGTRIRTIQKGEPQTYNVVIGVSINRNNGTASLNFDQYINVENDGIGAGNEITVEHQLRHPININTAPPEVLEACFKGLCLTAGGQTIDGAMAKQLAAFLTSGGRVYRDERDLMEALKQFQQQMSAQGLPFGADMRDAVYINATEPNSYRVRIPTATFCYKSYGSFTIDGTGVVNADNGLQLARSEIKQVITLPSPPPGDFAIQTQTDFQKRLDEGNGARLVTWPVAMPPPSKGRRQGFVKEPDINPKLGTNDIRLSVGQCGADATNVVDKGIDKVHVEHCDDFKNSSYFQDGYNLSKGGAQGFEYPGIHVSPGGWMSPGGVEAWIKPGATSDFYIFDQGDGSQNRNRVSFFYDSAKPGFVMRIWDANLQGKFVEYLYPAKLDSNEWYHVAGSWHSSTFNGMEARVDANPISRDGDIQFHPSCKLSGGLSEIATSVNVEPPEDATDFETHYPSQGGAIRVGQEIIEYQQRNGYNFAVCRRGTRLSAAVQHSSGEIVQPYGYAARVPNDRDVIRGGGTLVDRLDTNVKTNISKPTPPNILYTDDILPVVSAVSFPPTGYIYVAGEVMYYGAKTATSFTKLIRGQGGSEAKDHNHNEEVRLCSIQVTNANAYTRPNGNGDGYDNLVQIDNATDNKVVEWIQYGEVMQGRYLVARLDGGGSGGNQNGVYKAGLRNMGMTGMRGRKLTLEADHMAKAKVIPVQTIAGPWLGDQNSTLGLTLNDDVSTLSIVLKGQSGGELRRVKRAYGFQYAQWASVDPTRTPPALYPESGASARNKYNLVRAQVFVSWGFEYLAAFDDFTQRDYPGQQVRLIRWPSGELPDSNASQRKLFTDLSGQGRFEGKVDEVKTVTLLGRGAMVVGKPKDIQDDKKAQLQGFLSGDQTLTIELPTAWPRPLGPENQHYNYRNQIRPDEDGESQYYTKGGLIKIDDELIYFQSASNAGSDPYLVDTRPAYTDKATLYSNKMPLSISSGRKTMRLTGLKRGVLGTAEADHAAGASVLTYEAMPVALLSGAISSTAEAFSVSNGQGFADEGYVWIDDEALSYQIRKKDEFSGCQPWRGRFGTSGSEHPSGSIVRSLPFRYWDRCPVEYDGTGQAFFQAGHSEENTIWDSFNLRTIPGDCPTLPNGLQPLTIVRFDGKPNWNMTPTNRPGGLFAFNGIGNFGLGGMLADRMEMRVYWQYKPGAFYPNMDWKRNVGMDELSASYHHPLKIHRVEQIEKR